MHSSEESSDKPTELKKALTGDHVRLVLGKPVTVRVSNDKLDVSEVIYSAGVFWLRCGDNKVQRCTKYELEKWKPFETWFMQSLPEE